MTGSSSGLLALGALGSQAHLSVKDEKNHHELDHRGATWGRGRGGAGVWAEALKALLWADTVNAVTLGPGLSTPWSHPSVKFLVHGNQSPIPQAHPAPIPEVYPLFSALEDIWSFLPGVPSHLPSYILPTLQG